jgi:hypothetical protein
MANLSGQYVTMHTKTIITWLQLTLLAEKTLLQRIPEAYHMHPLWTRWKTMLHHALMSKLH